MLCLPGSSVPLQEKAPFSLQLIEEAALCLDGALHRAECGEHAFALPLICVFVCSVHIYMLCTRVSSAYLPHINMTSVWTLHSLRCL